MSIQDSLIEINGYVAIAKNILKDRPYDPSAQNVVFYADQAILALNRRDPHGFRNMRAQVIGYSV